MSVVLLAEFNRKPGAGGGDPELGVMLLYLFACHWSWTTCASVSCDAVLVIARLPVQIPGLTDCHHRAPEQVPNLPIDSGAV